MPEPKTTDARRGLSISVPQLVASVLASVSAAIVASFFGVAGTIVGTALGSLVATLGSAIYLHSITRTTSYVQRHRPASGEAWLASVGSAATRPANASSERRPAARADPVPGGPTSAQRPAAGAPQVAVNRSSDGLLRRTFARLPLGRRFGWKGGLIAVVVVFLVAIGVVTGIERAASATLSHLIGGSRSPNGSTTVGRVFSGGPSPQNEPSPSPSTTAPSGTVPPASPTTTTTTTTLPPASTEPPTTTTTTEGVGQGPTAASPDTTTTIP